MRLLPTSVWSYVRGPKVTRPLLSLVALSWSLLNDTVPSSAFTTSPSSNVKAPSSSEPPTMDLLALREREPLAAYVFSKPTSSELTGLPSASTYWTLKDMVPSPLSMGLTVTV